MPAFWGNIVKNRLCDLQVMPGARIAWLGGGTQKVLYFESESVDQKKKSSSRNMRGFLRILRWTQKKVFHLKKCANFYEFRVETTKKGSFLRNLQKTVLAHESWGYNQYLGSLKPRTALQWHRACYFLMGTILAWGAQFFFGGTSSDLGAGMPPVASGLLQNYSNLSKCNYRIFVWEILLKIGFIEEMRTIWGNKEVPQTFFQNFLYLRKYDLIRLTPYHCQPRIRNFVTLQKA